MCFISLSLLFVLCFQASVIRWRTSVSSDQFSQTTCAFCTVVVNYNTNSIVKLFFDFLFRPFRLWFGSLGIVQD